MRNPFKIFLVKQEEKKASLVALLSFVALNAVMVCAYADKFMKVSESYWNTVVRTFGVSGFDPITYTVITDWEAKYNVYRHPFLAFFVYPLNLINNLLISLTGLNFAQILVALLLVFCGFYTYIFTYRILRELIKISRWDATMLSAMLFSFAYVMLSFIVPDHFGPSMFLLVLSLYICGKCIERGRKLKIWQTVVLFMLTAGVTLSNGVKTFIYSLFVNGRSFFRIKHLLLAVLLPSALIWGFARWEYRTFVWPGEMARKEAKAKANEQKRQRLFQAFCDTTSLKDSAEIRKAFQQHMNKRIKARYLADRKKAWNKNKGTPMAKGEFLRWTDVSTSRLETAVENLFGESLQLHRDHLLKDTLRSRPVIIPYRWAVSYVVEALIVLLFVAGIWCGRRSRFLWMCLSGFAFDMFLHLGLGFGINEVYIMSAHWLFVMPVAMAFLFKALSGRSLLALRTLALLLTAYLFIYNGILTVGYLVS